MTQELSRSSQAKWEAYKQGLNDKEAGLSLGCGELVMSRFRKRHGLPEVRSTEYSRFKDLELPPKATPLGAKKWAAPEREEPVRPVALSRPDGWYVVPRVGQYWLKDGKVEGIDPWGAGQESPVLQFMEENQTPPALMFTLVGNAQSHLIPTAVAGENFLLLLAPGVTVRADDLVMVRAVPTPQLGTDRGFIVRLEPTQSILLEQDGQTIAEVAPIPRPSLRSPGLVDLGEAFAVVFSPDVTVDCGLPASEDGWNVRVSRWPGEIPEPAFNVQTQPGSSVIQVDLRRTGPGRIRLEVMDDETASEPISAFTVFWDPRVRDMRLNDYSPLPGHQGHSVLEVITRGEEELCRPFRTAPEEDQIGFALHQGDDSTWVHLAVPRIWWRLGTNQTHRTPGPWTDLPIQLGPAELASGRRLEFRTPSPLTGVQLANERRELVPSRKIGANLRAVLPDTLRSVAGQGPGRAGLVLWWRDHKATMATFAQP